MKTFATLLVIFLSLSAKAEDKYYVVIGQSNANWTAKYAGLEQKLATWEGFAHIINCGHPAQKIDAFTPNWDVTSIYGDCMAKVGDKKISGIIFWQGESDAATIPLVKAWSAQAMNLIRTLRQDLGDLQMRVVMVVLNSQQKSKYYPYWLSMRILQQRLNAPNLFKVDSTKYVYRSEGAGRENEHLHLTPAGYDAIGNEIASKMLTF